MELWINFEVNLMHRYLSCDCIRITWSQEVLLPLIYSCFNMEIMKLSWQSKCGRVLLQRPHMASFSFNTLQQKHLFSITLSKYPSTLKAFKFQYLSQFSTFSPLRHSLEPRFFPLLVVRANVSQTETRLSITDQTPTKTINLRTGKETGAGFSSVRAIDERVVSESVKDIVGLELEEKKKMRLRKDKYVRKNLGFRESRKMGSGGSSLRSMDENVKVNSLESAGSLLVKEKMEKKSRKGGHNHVGENKGKRSRKNKVDLPEVQLRVSLDMCSKRGDVLGAIQLYDLALREGKKMEQYHYAVLLYLCSSAALGVIRPAKSGRANRTLNTLDSPNGVSVVNSIRLSALRDKGDRNLGGLELNVPVSNNGQLVDFSRSHGTANKMELNSSNRFDNLSSTFDDKENLTQFSNGIRNSNSLHLDGLNYLKKGGGDFSHIKDGSDNQEDHTIRVGEDVMKYALQRGFEIYEKMRSDNVPMNEATLTSVARMAMSMGIGDVAFDMVKQMKPLGINPRLRSYGPALSSFCNIGDIDKAFAVEKHMLEHGVYPEEPELEALLRVSVGAGKGDKVYYLLHKLRTGVRKVSTTTADLIVKWFNSKAASRVGKTKWDKRLIKKAIENGGGGWHGQGWLGKGRWNVSYTTIGAEGLCKCCGEKLAIIDLDPKETENFGESVASIAINREKNSTFQKFQKWLDYYGPFEAVVDAANVGLFGQSRFVPSKVGAVVNGIRQKLPSKKWPLIILHNKRLAGRKMDEPVNRALIEKWKNADALFATPTGSNDDWYWLYAAIKFKCLIVTNDEMRDHTFQLLGNDFFPKWKERHQVHFSFSGVGPVFHMPPPCSVVIQESDEGHWHIPVISELDYEAERTWLCVTRDKSRVARRDSATSAEESPSLHDSKKDASPDAQTEIKIKSQPNRGTHGNTTSPSREIYKNLRDLLSASVCSNHDTVLAEIEAAEKLGNCIIDFQI